MMLLDQGSYYELNEQDKVNDCGLIYRGILSFSGHAQLYDLPCATKEAFIRHLAPGKRRIINKR